MTDQHNFNFTKSQLQLAGKDFNTNSSGWINNLNGAESTPSVMSDEERKLIYKTPKFKVAFDKEHDAALNNKKPATNELLATSVNTGNNGESIFDKILDVAKPIGEAIGVGIEGVSLNAVLPFGTGSIAGVTNLVNKVLPNALHDTSASTAVSAFLTRVSGIIGGLIYDNGKTTSDINAIKNSMTLNDRISKEKLYLDSYANSTTSPTPDDLKQLNDTYNQYLLDQEDQPFVLAGLKSAEQRLNAKLLPFFSLKNLAYSAKSIFGDEGPEHGAISNITDPRLKLKVLSLIDLLNQLDIDNKQHGTNFDWSKPNTWLSYVDSVDFNLKAVNWLNNNYAPSTDYLLKANNAHFNWTDPSSYYYTLPRVLGSSVSTPLDSAVPLVLSLAGSYFSGGSLGALAGSLATTVGTGVTTYNQRRWETNSEIYDNYNLKLLALTDSNKIDINSITQLTQQQLKSKGIDTTGMDDNTVRMLGVAHGVVTNDKKYNALVQESRSGLENLNNLNMNLMASDMLLLALVLPGIGRAYDRVLGKYLSGAKNAITGGIESSADKIFAGTLDNTARLLFKNKLASKFESGVIGQGVEGTLFKNTIKPILSKYGKPATELGLDAFMEGNEEVIQYVAGKDMMNNKYNEENPSIFQSIYRNINDTHRGLYGMNSIYRSVFDGLSYMLGTTKTDNSFVNDANLAENFKSGALVSLVMGGPTNIFEHAQLSAQDKKSYEDEVAGSEYAKRLLTNLTIRKDNVEKAKLFSRLAISKPTFLNGFKNKLDELKLTLPIGVKPEDIDEEKLFVNDIYNVVSNPKILSTISKLGIGKGSDDYHTYIGLLFDTKQLLDLHNKASNQLALNIDQAYNSKDALQWLANNQQKDSKLVLPLTLLALYNDLLNYTKLLKDKLTNHINDFNELLSKYLFNIDDSNLKEVINRLDDKIDNLNKLRDQAVVDIFGPDVDSKDVNWDDYFIPGVSNKVMDDINAYNISSVMKDINLDKLNKFMGKIDNEDTKNYLLRNVLNYNDNVKINQHLNNYIKLQEIVDPLTIEQLQLATNAENANALLTNQRLIFRLLNQLILDDPNSEKKDIRIAKLNLLQLDYFDNAINQSSLYIPIKTVPISPLLSTLLNNEVHSSNSSSLQDDILNNILESNDLEGITENDYILNPLLALTLPARDQVFNNPELYTALAKQQYKLAKLFKQGRIGISELLSNPLFGYNIEMPQHGENETDDEFNEIDRQRIMLRGILYDIADSIVNHFSKLLNLTQKDEILNNIKLDNNSVLNQTQSNDETVDSNESNISKIPLIEQPTTSLPKISDEVISLNESSSKEFDYENELNEGFPLLQNSILNSINELDNDAIKDISKEDLSGNSILNLATQGDIDLDKPIEETNGNDLFADAIQGDIDELVQTNPLLKKARLNERLTPLQDSIKPIDLMSIDDVKLKLFLAAKLKLPTRPKRLSVKLESPVRAKRGSAKLKLPTKPKRGSANSLMTNSEYEKHLKLINTNKAIRWLNKKLGLNSLLILVKNGVIKALSNGQKVYGVCKDDSIILSDISILGTEYHEAYHRVSLLMLNKELRLLIYDEFRQQNSQYKNYSNKDVEEILADKFKDYVINRNTITGLLKHLLFHNQLSNFIGKFIGIKLTLYDQLANKIANGNFKNYKLDKLSIEEFNNVYDDLVYFKAGVANKEELKEIPISSFYDTIHSLVSALFQLNDIHDISDIDNFNTNILKLYIESIANKETDTNKKAILDEMYTKFDSVYVPEIMKELRRLSLRSIDSEDGNFDISSKETSDDYTPSYDKMSIEISKKDNALVSSKLFIATIPDNSFRYYTDLDGNQLREIVPNIDPIIGFPKYINFDTSWNKMMHNLWNVDSWLGLLDRTYELGKGNEFFYSLNLKLDNLFTDDMSLDLLSLRNSLHLDDDILNWYRKINPKYAYITDNSKLESILKDDLEYKLALLTLLLSTIKGNLHNMFAVLYNTMFDDEGHPFITFSIDSSSTMKAIKSIPSIWSLNFYNNDNIIHKTDISVDIDDDSILGIQEMFNEIKGITDYEMSEADVDIAINKTVQLLNILGINIDKEVFNSMLNDPKLNKGSRLSTLNSIISNESSGSLLYIVYDTLNILGTNKTLLLEKINNLLSILNKTKLLASLLLSIKSRLLELNGKKKSKLVRTFNNIFDGLGNNSIIMFLAKHLAILNPNDEEMMVLGSNNNLLYPLSLDCYSSNTIKWLNEDPLPGLRYNEFVNMLSNATYNLHSKILDTIKLNGTKLKLNTFVNFRALNSGDKGRDYIGIAKLEDYIAKMTMTQNDHLIFPTMADKSMYFTITGVKLFHESISFNKDNDDNLSYIMGNPSLLYYYNSANDEFNTVKEYYANRDTVGQNKTLLVANYYTKDLRGGKFRYLTHLMLNMPDKNGKMSLLNIDLNLAIDLYDKLGRLNDFLDLIEKQMFYIDKRSSKEELSKLYNQRLSIINDTLLPMIYQEIETAKKLGLVELVDGLLKNKLLDQLVLSSYMNGFSRNGVSSDLIKNLVYAEHLAIVSMLSNFALNTAMSTIEIEKIFSGDPAFYKNDDDKIKRYPAILSTGDNLRTDFNDNDPLTEKDTFNVGELNDNEILSQLYNYLHNMFLLAYLRKYLILMVPGINELNVDDIILDPTKINDKLLVYYNEAIKLAKITADVASSGYGLNSNGKGNINLADAAVYISPSMYESIIKRLGEWNGDVSKAFAIMEGSEDWESNPTLYAKSLLTLIKPLKMMYFGLHPNELLHINIPIFDKMAMFPIFKSIATGDLSKLYERMTGTGKYSNLKDNKIDVCAFTSAIKVGSLSPMSFYKDTENTLISDLNNMFLHQLKFLYLRRLMVTDPHTDERELLGTLVAKAAMSNIVSDRIYGKDKKEPIFTINGNKPTGEDLSKELFGSMNALSNKGIDIVNQLLIGEDGLVDPTKLSNTLINAAQASGMGDCTIDDLSTINGQFELPLSASSDSHWYESSMISTINKNTIDINMPGSAFILMSSFGVKSITPVSDRALNGGKRLKLHNEDGSMDSIVSINLFSHIIPNYNKLSFIEAKLWLLDNEIIGEYSNPSAMGYRIPTLGLSSISSLRFVDVMPLNIGSTIILPDEFTALTGSDFDIDKLYVARYNYEKYQDLDHITRMHKVQFNDYKEGNKWLLNSRLANENRLLDVYMTLLTDPTNIDETKLPLDNTTNIIKNEILPIVDGKFSNLVNYSYLHAAPTYQLNKKYEYSGGKMGIAPFALNNVHHVLTLLTKLGFEDNDISILLELGLLSLSGIDSRSEHDYLRDKYGYYKLDDKGRLIDLYDKGERILDWISALINAHVDVAKDPYVIRLNINKYTYNMTNFLLRTGYGKNTFYFLPLNILKDIAEEVSKNEGNYKPTDLTLNLVIGQVIDKYTKLAKYYNSKLKVSREDEIKDALSTLSIDDKNIEGSINVLKLCMNRDFLIHNIILGNMINANKLLSDELYADYYINLLIFYKLYNTLEPYSKSLSNLVHLSLIDTKKFGNSFALQQLFMYKLKLFAINDQNFNIDDLQKFYNTTFLDLKIKNSIIYGNLIFKGQLLRNLPSFNRRFRLILSLTGNSETNDEQLLKTISNSIEASIKSLFFNDELLKRGENINSMLYGDYSMAKRLARFKTLILTNPRYSDLYDSDNAVIKNDLLNYLNTWIKSSTEELNAPDIITTPRLKSNDKYLLEKLLKYWEGLLEDPREEVSNFAKDLVLYSFVTSGDNMSSNSFFNYVPKSERLRLGYGEFIRDQLSLDNIDNQNVLDIFLNNYNNKYLVPEVSLKDRRIWKINSTLYIDKTPIPMIISTTRLIPVGFNRSGEPVYKPFIKVNMDGTNDPSTTFVYRLVGVNKDKNLPIYILTEKKGMNMNGRNVYEYNNSTSSNLSFNNLPFDFNPSNNLNLILSSIDSNNKYNYIKFLNSYDLKKWLDILDEKKISPIDSYYIEDPANTSTYDDIFHPELIDINFNEKPVELYEYTEEKTFVLLILDLLMPNSEFYNENSNINITYAGDNNYHTIHISKLLDNKFSIEEIGGNYTSVVNNLLALYDKLTPIFDRITSINIEDNKNNTSTNLNNIELLRLELSEIPINEEELNGNDLLLGSTLMDLESDMFLNEKKDDNYDDSDKC